MRTYGTSRCKSCGKEIIWIKMASGKNMPCDAGGILCREDVNGELTLVIKDGKMVRATRDKSGDMIGYTSHFATCPNANRWRKEMR